MKKFKVGVSNWEVVFEHEEKIEFKEVSSQIVTMFSSGKVRIVLENVTFDNQFVELFKENQIVYTMKECFKLMDNVGQVTDNIEYEYNNLEVKKIKIISSTDSVTTLTATFAG